MSDGFKIKKVLFGDSFLVVYPNGAEAFLHKIHIDLETIVLLEN